MRVYHAYTVFSPAFFPDLYAIVYSKLNLPLKVTICKSKQRSVLEITGLQTCLVMFLGQWPRISELRLFIKYVIIYSFVCLFLL